MASKVESALLEQQAKLAKVEDQRAFFYPNLDAKQRARIDLLQKVLDKRFQDKKTLEQINLQILFNPEHEEFLEHYAFEDPVKDDLIQSIQLRSNSRQLACVVTVFTYMVARNILWNRGIGGKFFHYTRYTTLPIFAGVFFYCTFTKTSNDLQQAGVYDYNLRRNRFINHSKAAQTVTKLHLDYLKTVQDRDQQAHGQEGGNQEDQIVQIGKNDDTSKGKVPKVAPSEETMSDDPE